MTVAIGARRTLVVMRHAKSDWPPYVADIDRPLGDRGRSDATAAGYWLAKQDFALDLVLVSPALRTRQTWSLVKEELDPKPPQEISETIYAAHWTELLQVARGIGPEHQAAVMVGHNPGSAMLATRLAGADSDRRSLDILHRKYPTLGCAVLEFTGDWAELDHDRCVLREFAVPRG